MDSLIIDESHKSGAWAQFKRLLNRRPVLVTFGLGLVSYAIAFGLGLLGVFLARNTLLYSGICLLGALVVIVYHFLMARYQTTSWFAQVIHLIGALFFTYISLALSLQTGLLMD